jgi:hypothetical protein
MKSANSYARSVRILVAGVAAAAVLALAPSQATASSFSDVNPCVDSYWGPMTEIEAEKGRLGECTPATSGLFPIWNENLVDPILNLLNSYFGRNAVGGPVQAYRERVMGEPAQAEQFARAVRRLNGDGMAAGYTPTETTGEWIQRHLQPLRDHRINGWFNTTWSSPRDTHRPTRYDSDIWTFTVGADVPLMDDALLAGFFGSYTNSDVDTTFNTGGVNSKIGTFGPYFAYTLNEFVSFDTTVGVVVGEHENTVGTVSGPTGEGSSPKARGDQEVDGFFIAMNANGNYWVGNWGVQGRLGFLHSDMETDSYNLSSGGVSIRIPGMNNEITQISLATQANYFYDKGLPYFENVMMMPFFRITWNYDLDHDNIQLPFGVPQHPNDDDEVVLGWGATFFGNGPFSGSVEAGRTLARSRFESWTVSGNLNYAF